MEINPVCVLTAIAKSGIGFSADQLKSFPIRENEIVEFYAAGRQTCGAAGGSQPSASASVSFEEGSGAPLVNLLKYCIDKTATAEAAKIHPIVIRDRETRMMMEILGRHSKPNEMIVGESGVGKTALLYGAPPGFVGDGVIATHPTHLLPF